jgi:hypothetical protein
VLCFNKLFHDTRISEKVLDSNFLLLRFLACGPKIIIITIIIISRSLLRKLILCFFKFVGYNLSVLQARHICMLTNKGFLSLYLVLYVSYKQFMTKP